MTAKTRKKMVNTVLFHLLTVSVMSITLLSDTVIAQSQSADTIKCFAQCKIPYQYKYDTIKVVDKPQHKILVKVPGSFVVTHDTITYSSGDSMIRQVPAVYDVYEEKVLVSNKKESPRYKSVTKYIVLEEARTEHLSNILKQKPVTVYEQVDATKTRKVEAPATYTYVITKTIVPQKETTVETEIICPHKITPKLIRQVQEHLKMSGYAVNNSSKELGETTIESLEKYQQENQLPVGELNIPTLKSLNITY